MNPAYTGQGFLQIKVTTESPVVPISGARVRISDPTDGTVLQELTTNSSGQTEPVDLPTPPLEYSVNAGEPKPYASYSVTVFAEGFKTLHIGGVQLLPSGLALQPAALTPATAGGINVQNRYISPHTLWGDFPPKIPEDEVKPLPDADGLVVLPKPVIPEYIIVHLGKPSDQGVPNEWVLFRDYIKNVACSEIYATWARETIKANVLAIISFTLNRVYTEWYRGKGYDFTITNSTAYDQSFVPGRTIFEEISVVVDDLFNTYITREGAGQPLLTQYCDGRQTQCNGLSQWGSQALGEQGWDAISILRRYYGSDIYLAPAEKVEGVPMSFGGETLTVGAAGEDVRTIQLQLNRISENFPALPRVRADGVYGTETQEAVRTFQSIFLLPQTGDVDFATWYSISNIYVAVAKLA